MKVKVGQASCLPPAAPPAPLALKRSLGRQDACPTFFARFRRSRGDIVLRGILILGVGVLLSGCGIYHRQGLESAQVSQIESGLKRPAPGLSRELEDRILALDANNVTARDVREVLSLSPAPRVVNIHGGIAKVIPRMVSFSEFLSGMGYPAASLTNPSDGTYSFSCYESSEKIAGVIAWFYEKEGLRPLLVGHSQGGMQVVKVLHKFAGKSARLHVWNPLTWEQESRCEIIDPLSGERRSVAGLRLPYATTVGAGGLTRLLPNQWDMTLRLRTIPDSVEEFTGFCKELDLLGGDFLGYGPANHFKADGAAVVRNVWLPTEYKHGEIPNTKHLLNDPELVDWINRYRPTDEAIARPTLDAQFESDSSHILWAADVWFSIKRHWVLELQRSIRSQWSTEEGKRGVTASAGKTRGQAAR
jgi:pimeloyl-ACP methyl ester carboxylesterase